jgi:hypothetical protein
MIAPDAGLLYSRTTRSAETVPRAREDARTEVEVSTVENITEKYACSPSPLFGALTGAHGVVTGGTRVVAPVRTTVQGTTASIAMRTRTTAASTPAAQAIALLPISDVVVFDKDIAGIRTWSPPV